MSARFLRFLSPAEQARAVADEHYVALMGDVLRITESRLSRRHIDLDRKDVEAAYNQAWHGVCQRIARGEGVENLTGLLVDITYKRSLDIYRQCHEAMHTDDGLEGVDGLESRATSGDLAEQADDRGKLMGLFERLKGRLNTNERKAITLCILHGYSRAEAAKVLGIPEPTFQRIIDAAWKKVASVATGLDGRGCGDDEWARALRSFALGLIDEDHRDYHRISEHVQKCELPPLRTGPPRPVGSDATPRLAVHPVRAPSPRARAHGHQIDQTATRRRARRRRRWQSRRVNSGWRGGRRRDGQGRRSRPRPGRRRRLDQDRHQRPPHHAPPLRTAPARDPRHTAGGERARRRAERPQAGRSDQPTAPPGARAHPGSPNANLSAAGQACATTQIRSPAVASAETSHDRIARKRTRILLRAKIAVTVRKKSVVPKK